jgi:hypothetical protein
MPGKGEDLPQCQSHGSQKRPFLVEGATVRLNQLHELLEQYWQRCAL